MSNQVDERELEEVTGVVIFGENFNIYGDINNPLFLGVDVAAMIEYDPDKVGQMLELVDDDEKLTDTIYRGGQRRQVWFVTEYGLYELLMQSRKPLAKKFKLVIKNILKQIRMGTYEQPRRVTTSGNGCRTFYNARLIFRNFAGEPSQYNKAGDRNFGLVVDDLLLADQLMAEGWNLKPLKQRDEDDTPKFQIPVAVRYDNFPPKVYKISGKRKTLLDEDAVGSWDNEDFATVEVTISPSSWTMNGKTGVKAYLKVMFVTLAQDELSAKYSDDEEDEMPFE